MCPTESAKNMFQRVFLPEHTKGTGIGECVGMPRNYSISKLKLCQNLIFVQAKNGFPSSLDNSLESERKILRIWKIRLMN